MMANRGTRAAITGHRLTMTITKCPTCGARVEWSPKSPYRPFCSKRCRLIDLGAWLDGSNRIPGNELEADALDQLEDLAQPANDDTD